MNGVRRHRALVPLAAAALLLAACTPDLPTVEVDPDTTVGPVLSVSQDAEIHAAIGSALEEATAAVDPGTLEARVTGPALALRKAELTVASAAGNTDNVTEIPTVVQSRVIPATDDWPRTAFSVTERPQNLQTERLLVTEQLSPREPYKLWAWVRLFPGVTLPTFPTPEAGTEPVQIDDASLSISPGEALTHYVDVLNNGDASQYVGEFAADPFRDQINARRELRTADAATISGTYTLAFQASEGEVRALRTADGGALVVGQITSTETLAGEEGAVINPSATDAAFTGGAAPSNSLTTGRTAVVAVHVPPAGSADQLTLVGSEILTTSASVP
ncbi:hypothetical protein [Sanguibacter suaedae]|uniref:DUF8094 domain-containing protein n=1 Tax=Sanguibacter suaedae TaxID=2795737 RepID=A0A934IFL0_9MICO|nr:hypothetical protein [Sanguibacter suaedae]MBI9116079.1 hypothetical protein [Sanguibacter suaedae]